MHVEQQAIYDNTLTYLQKNLPPDFYAEDFSIEQSDELIAKLLTIIDEKTINENKEYIRKAFLDYFSTHNYEILVIFKNINRVILKEKATTKQKKYSRVMQKINLTITRHREEIDACWTQKNVLVVCSEIMTDLYSHTKSLDSSIANELIKKSFRHSLQLNLKDVIFFMSKKLVVKKFMEREKQEPINKRFGGLPPEELEEMKATYFAQSLWFKIEPKVYELLENDLNFALITNDFFISNYIKYLQNIFTDIVSETMQEDEQIIESFSNFLLREHFDSLLLLIAKHLAKQASKREGDAEGFLRYYNGDTMLTSEGKPIIKPDIIDKYNNHWNALTIMSMSMQYYHQLTKIKASKEELEPYKQEIDIHDSQHKELAKMIESLAKEKEEFEENSQEFFKETEKQKAELIELKKEAKTNPSDKLNADINELSTKIKRSYRKEEQIFDQRKEIDKKINSLNTKIGNHKIERVTMFKKYEKSKQKVDVLQEEFHTIDDKYELAMSALAKTLSKKPRPV